MWVRRRARRSERGQALVEYSIINWLLIVALVLALTVRMIPGPKDASGVVQRRNVMEMFLDAFSQYYNSFYFTLNLPFP